jgi:hypothetical protein
MILHHNGPHQQIGHFPLIAGSPQGNTFPTTPSEDEASFTAQQRYRQQIMQQSF